jgi:asparagine synthase (glutamine-hydrolysing)
MCGIAGIFRRDGAPVDAATIVRMTRTLVHRGPDEEGYYVNADLPSALPVDAPFRRHHDPHARAESSRAGHVGLGHRRLSIIDLNSGQQPLCNENGSIWITYNGEVYNFGSLTEELESRGHRFRTRSDTEAIVHAYEEWGLEAVSRLRGMFAFALWDEPRQRLVLARDRVGKKPLYYLADEDRLVFGSEIKAVLEAGNVPRDLDLTALSDYLSLLYVPAPKTIFRSVRKLPAAHLAVITSSSIDVHPYWDLPFEPCSEQDEGRLMEGLMETLDEATRMRMISEVPLGAFLSGGVDSSAIVGLMAQASPEPVVTNSISFSVSSYDEAPFARRVSELFRTEHHEYHVTPQAIPVVEHLAWNYDEPFADSSSVPTYYVSETARRNVTVALSGDGGDENFAGYRRYYFDMRENWVRGMLPHFLSQRVFAALGRLYPKADYLPQVFRGKAFISNVARDPVDAYFFSMSAFDDEQKQPLLLPDISNQLAGYRTADLFREIYDDAPAEDHLSRIQYLDIKTYLSEDILTKVDRASMAVSLEVRCPILDHVFMEYAARIPWRRKLVGTDGKHIFKKALKRILPDEILYRKKMGFGVPILEWLRGDLEEYGAALVLEGEASKRLFRRAFLERIWRQHQQGVRNWATELWLIMMLNLWFNNFAGDGEPSRSAVAAPARSIR